jgi:hypothetical protein
MSGSCPTQFVDSTARQNERGTRASNVVKSLATGKDFILDVPAQYHMQEVLRMLVAWDDAGWDLVILDGETSPFDRRAR